MALTLISVSKRLDERTVEAIEAATASLRSLARAAGLHYTTLTRWRKGQMSVGPESARALARALRERALRVLDLAARLEAQADKEDSDEG